MAASPSSDLGAALAALATHDWESANAAASRAHEHEPSPEVSEALAEAAWWLGRVEESIEWRERAYNAYAEAGDGNGASNMAMKLSEDHLFRGRPVVARAWLSRAERHVDGEAPTIEAGRLAIYRAEAAHGRGDLDDAAAHAREAVEIGREFGDANVEADALQALGRVLVAGGRVGEGLAAYDDAMLAATSGRLAPYTTGKVYCSMISACEELGDFQRASEWIDAGAGWANEHPFALFPGLCRVHRAETRHLKGEWDAALAMAEQACRDLLEISVPHAASAHHEVGQIHRLRGDLDAAEAAFNECEALGGLPEPGRSILRLTRGATAEAAASIHRALERLGIDPLRRARLLPAATEIGVAAGNLADAAAWADELQRHADTFDSDGFAVQAATARARVALAEDRTEDALVDLRTALHRWQELAMPYEVATVRCLLGQAHLALGDEDAATGCFDAAERDFDELGAPHELERLRALRDPGTSTPPAGLSEREVEVLGLVARGLTNKQIAAELYLSQKTVARHLSNIFAKTGVTSRSAATAFAFEHGLA